MGTIRMPQSIHYGEGSMNKLSHELDKLGEKALIISDKPMNDLGYIDQLKTLMSDNHIASTTYLGVDAETKDTHVEEALAIYKNDHCDFIIALGGGSCIDAAKACAVLITNKDVELMDYVGDKAIIQHQPAPVVAIPTTAGTGSEVTDAFVVTNTKLDIKMMIKQPVITPQVAIVDPLLTVSAPRPLTVATGVDALSHALEAFISKKSHPFTSELALSAIQTIVNNIRQVFEDGSNVLARTNMSLSSMQAGIAFSNSSVTLVHGMSRPIGALFHIPHGISNAMLLAPVFEYSLDHCVKEMAEIGRVIDGRLKEMTDIKAAEGAVSIIKQLCSDLEVPNLKEWGIDEQEFTRSLDKMAEDALASGSPDNNPKVPTKEEIIKLYQTCYSYN